MYKHSSAFHDLKNTKEQIAGNLTSAQYLQTLDYLMWRALEPIVRYCPTFFNNYISKIIAYQALKPNVKYSSDDKAELPSAFLKYLLSKSAEDAKAMHLNRGIYLGLLREFEQTTKPIIQYSTAGKDVTWLGMQLYEHALTLSGCICKDTVYQVVQEVTYWQKLAIDFKQVIVEKYTRLTINQARRTYIDFNHAKDLDDIVQTYMLVLNKAIDRCDSRLGVLTTYINTWLKTARGLVKASLENIDQSLDSILEDSPNLESLGSITFDETYEALQNIAYIASRIDEVGAVRTVLGIPQYVTVRQVQRLRSYAV